MHTTGRTTRRHLLHFTCRGLPALALMVGLIPGLGGCVTSSKSSYERHLAATVPQTEPTLRVETVAFQREVEVRAIGGRADVVMP